MRIDWKSRGPGFDAGRSTESRSLSLFYFERLLQERPHRVGAGHVHAGRLAQALGVPVDASEQRGREPERDLLCLEVLHGADRTGRSSKARRGYHLKITVVRRPAPFGELLRGQVSAGG